MANLSWPRSSNWLERLSDMQAGVRGTPRRGWNVQLAASSRTEVTSQ